MEATHHSATECQQTPQTNNNTKRNVYQLCNIAREDIACTAIWNTNRSILFRYSIQILSLSPVLMSVSNCPTTLARNFVVFSLSRPLIFCRHCRRDNAPADGGVGDLDRLVLEHHAKQLAARLRVRISSLFAAGKQEQTKVSKRSREWQFSKRTRPTTSDLERDVSQLFARIGEQQVVVRQSPAN